MRKMISFDNDHFIFLHKGTNNKGTVVFDRNFGAQAAVPPTTIINATTTLTTKVVANTSNCNLCRYTISAKGGGGANPQLVKILLRKTDGDTQIVLLQTLTARTLSGAIELDNTDSVVVTLGAISGTKSATVTLDFSFSLSPTTNIQTIIDPLKYSWTVPGTYNNIVIIPDGYTLADFVVNCASGGAGSGAHRVTSGGVTSGGGGGGTTSIEFIGLGKAGGNAGGTGSSHTSTGRNAFSTNGGGGAGGNAGSYAAPAYGSVGAAGSLIRTGNAANASVNVNGIPGGARNAFGTDGNTSGGAFGGLGGSGAIVSKTGAVVVGGSAINVIVGAAGAAGYLLSGSTTVKTGLSTVTYPWFAGSTGRNGSVSLTLRGA